MNDEALITQINYVKFKSYLFKNKTLQLRYC